MHKVTEVFVGTAIFEPRQLTLQLNLSALSYREGRKPGTFLGDGICASPSVIGAVRTIWGGELVGEAHGPPRGSRTWEPWVAELISMLQLSHL